MLIAGKLFISTIQILIALPQVFEVILPDNFLRFVAWFKVFNLSFVELFDIGCISRVNQHGIMVSATVIPFVLCVPILIIWAKNAIADHFYRKPSSREGGDSEKVRSLSMNSIR